MAYQKGVSGNPGGAPSLNPALKMIRLESRESMIKLFWKIVNLTKSDIEQLLSAKPEPSIVEEGIIRAIIKDMAKGQTLTIQMLMDRTIGKPKEFIDISGKINIDKSVDMSKLSVEEIDQLISLMKKGSIPSINDK